MSFSLVYEAQVTFNYLFFIIWSTFFTSLCLNLFQFLWYSQDMGVTSFRPEYPVSGIFEIIEASGCSF